MKSNLGKFAYIQLDIAFAGFLFLIITSTVYALQTSKIQSYQDQNELLELQAFAKDLCFSLSQTKGNPTNWYSSISSIKTIGLLNNSLELDQNKLNQLINSNYITIKNNLKIDKFNFYIQIQNSISNMNLTNFGYQNSVPLSKKYSCYSTQNNEIIKISVEAWK